jgi:membrane-bound ClpP family serine protease
MAQRSFLYPLSTCITLPFEAIFLILYGCGLFVFELGIPKAITLGLSGLLTGIAFVIDPATHQAFKSAYYQVTNKNQCKKFNGDKFLNTTDDIPL